MKKITLISVLMLMFAVTAGCSGNSTGLIGEEKAKSIALSDAGLGADGVTFIKASFDTEDGKKVYDVEFYSADYTEYDYEIDGKTGEILSYDKDIEKFTPNQSADNSQSQGNRMSEADAKKVALERVPGSTEADIRGFHFETDDGIEVYEGKIIYNQKEYEFEINASTGEFINWETESAVGW